jgi:hypothetical protein
MKLASLRLFFLRLLHFWVRGVFLSGDHDDQIAPDAVMLVDG